VDKHLQGFACSYSRTVVELTMAGEYKDLDGIVIPYACDTTRCLDLVFKFTEDFAFTDCLRIPKRNDADGLDKYFRAELGRLAAHLGEFTGQAVTGESLAAAIKDYNRVRALAGRARAKAMSGAVPASGYFAAVRAAMALPVEESEPLLADLAESWKDKTAAPNGGPKVVLAGKLPEPPGVVDVIAKAGLSIVEDHLTVGGRWVEAQVDETIDPWEGLIKRQVSRLPFAGIWDCRPSRASYLIDRVKATGADGVVFMVQKFCEPAELDYPGIRQDLDAAGIPMLQVETDFRATSLEVVRTRVEAFAEMLKGGK
jgi:benzoyl-CoA reductase/2-hydroxyglutaryl-CoA dehydratase subunit BcrC/BadD/HgdB